MGIKRENKSFLKVVVAKWNLKDKPFSSTKCEPDIQLKHKSGTRGSQKILRLEHVDCFSSRRF